MVEHYTLLRNTNYN